MVEVDQTQGRVKRIGLRHVQITTFANVDILVPNSKFLEENVINWTLESNVVRSDFDIAVNFDSPPGKVAEILVGCARLHDKVIKDPEPEAYLEQVNSDGGTSDSSFISGSHEEP